MDESIKFEPIGYGKITAVSPHHTFGTDAVLLADFSAAKAKDRAVDLGTGCGIIPFLMLRDSKLASAVGVDISEEAIELANIGAQKNGFSNFRAVCSDLNDLKGKVDFGNNTLVTCNPPYKKDGAGIQNEDGIIRAARHEISCNLEDIVRVGAKLLQTGGRLCMCHRPERLGELICLMSKYGVEPKRMRTVSKKPGEKPWLVLVEGKRSAKTGMIIEPTLYVEDENGNFSSEMIEIYGAYKEKYI